MEKNNPAANNESSLLRKIPQVNRARGFRLYLSNGKRLVDLWLNGGAAVLGHTPPNLLRELKNTASRGLYAPFPHFAEGRFLKALSKLLPGRSFRLYAAPPQELIKLHDEGKAKFWRPYVDQQNPFTINNEDGSLLVPVLPGIQTWRNGLPFGLCVIVWQTENAVSEETLSQFPPNDALPPVLLAAAARGVYDLVAAPERGKLNLPLIFKALKNGKWQRNGIYLTLKEEVNGKDWESLFYKFMEAGFLLPPSPSQPVILPGELSGGEQAKLASVIKI